MLTPDEYKQLISSKEFDEVLKGKGDISDRDISKLREGDLILREMNMDCSPLYHAGIYCRNEEVIEFTAPLGTKWYGKITMLFLPQQSAPVIKESVSNFLNGKSYKVFRLKSGIPEEFSNSVKSAMKSNEEYDLCRNNSLHFALRLLKLQAKPLPERNTSSDSKTTNPTGSQIQSTCTQDGRELLTSSTYKEFDEVMEGKGDISDSNVSKIKKDDVERPPMKNDEEGQSLLKTIFNKN